jgi:hypothetical protein
VLENYIAYIVDDGIEISDFKCFKVMNPKGEYKLELVES